MILQCRCDPLAHFHDGDWSYTFQTPIIINVERIATAKPGFYRPAIGSIISVSGPEFGIDYDFNLLVEAMRYCLARDNP